MRVRAWFECVTRRNKLSKIIFQSTLGWGEGGRGTRRGQQNMDNIKEHTSSLSMPELLTMVSHGKD